jgi:uncharacterized protein with ParB-like and HNH nuclease domain
MSNLQINTRVRRLFNLLNDFEKGIIRVPAFQRDFEWDNAKKKDLFDSIKEGYPVGSIFFWRPDFSRLEDFKNFESDKIGSYLLPERAIDYFYILDGYQRLSTLFGCLVNPAQTNLKRDDKDWKDKFNLIFNLETGDIETAKGVKYEIYEVPLFKFVDGSEFLEFQEELFRLNIPKEKANLYKQRYKDFVKILSSYEMPSVEIFGGTTEEATDIFIRLNSKGAKITDDWKVSALSFDKFENFRLGTEIDKLLEELAYCNFDKLSRKIVFQCITNAFGDFFYDQTSQNDIKKLKKLIAQPNFISTIRKTIVNIQQAVRFLFEELFVLDSRFLPYNNQLISITDFFNEIEQPTRTQLDTLRKWFWITTYSNYFTIYNLGKQRLAYQAFREFLKDENSNPIYFDNKENSFDTLEFPTKIGMGSVRAKALGLFMLQRQVKAGKLDVNVVNHYKTYKLFNGVEDNANTSENTILIIDDGTFQIPKSQKDLSNWLSSDEDHNKFFIDADMKMAFKNGASKETILAMRKKLVIEAEKSFVERLDLKYVE